VIFGREFSLSTHYVFIEKSRDKTSEAKKERSVCSL